MDTLMNKRERLIQKFKQQEESKNHGFEKKIACKHCRKFFNSKKQFMSHLYSKNHKKNSQLNGL